MANSGKFRGIDVAMDGDDLEDLQGDGQPGSARREYDVHGNPVHVPHRNLGSREVLSRLLGDDSLDVDDPPHPGATKRAAPNPAGLKKGYDPYESGLLARKEPRKKRDLRALSEWIKAKRLADSGEE